MNTALEAFVDRILEWIEALPVGPLDTMAKHQYLARRLVQLIVLLITHASVIQSGTVMDNRLLRRGPSERDGHLFYGLKDWPAFRSETLPEQRAILPCYLGGITAVCTDPGAVALLRGVVATALASHNLFL